MKKIFGFIVKFRFFFLLFWIAATVASIIFIPQVNINYDSTAYLPKDTRIYESLQIMEEEFGITGQASIMIEDVSIEEAIRYKKNLKEKSDVIMEIVWLDSFVDEDVLLEINDLWADFDPTGTFDIGAIPGLNQFYKNRSALYQVVFTQKDHSLAVGKAIEDVRDYLTTINKTYAMSGTAISAYYTRISTTQEVLKITLYVIPIILLILFIFTHSWVEPLLFLISVGVSVLVNMGTNAIFAQISFLTNSTASLLQLAITMDYSIFLLHQYTKQRKQGLSPSEAMKEAMTKSFLSINSSMLTTAAGFVALMFMRYTIGLDLASVMLKGIGISLITTFTLMPPLILYFSKLLEKTAHRAFFPSLGRLSKWIIKLRYVLPALALIVLVPTFYGQSQNTFVYGESAMSLSEGSSAAEENKKIEIQFGKSNMIVVLVPNGDESKELALIKEIQDTIKQDVGIDATAQSLATLTNIKSYIPNYSGLDKNIRDFIENIFQEDWILDQIPEQFISQFQSDNYSRIIISVPTDAESEQAFKVVRTLNSVVPRHYPTNYHIIGSSSSVQDIKEVVEKDFNLINIISIVLILIILFIGFKSWTLPVVLVLVIELSIWINMAIPYLLGSPLIFIGYMIVSSVQLGATIDYGILFTQTYTEARQTMKKRDALKYALTNSGHSILTSSLILGTAGFTLSFMSSVTAVSSLGELIGRGAFLSGFLVIFLLPQLLILLDGVINKTTKKANFIKDSDAEEII